MLKSMVVLRSAAAAFALLYMSSSVQSYAQTCAPDEPATVESMMICMRIWRQEAEAQREQVYQAVEQRLALSHVPKSAQFPSQGERQGQISLNCRYQNRTSSHSYVVTISNIREPDEDLGTSLVWSGRANYSSTTHATIRLFDRVRYGGPPEDIALSFSNQLGNDAGPSLHSTATGLAGFISVRGEWNGGLISCDMSR